MKKVSKKTIQRAFLYIRTLKSLIKKNRHVISSKELAEIIGTTDVQIRKDISKFGKVGKPGIGYKTVELKSTLEDFILQEDVVKVALFGVGNLGTAILKYPEFYKDRIQIVVAFEKDKRKIGKEINEVKVYSVKEASKIMEEKGIDIGIIAVPKEYSQEVADVIVSADIKGIINFAPASINVPKEVRVKNIDLSIEFLSLYCNTKM